MNRYTGIFSYISYLFLHYSILSGPYNALALDIGVFGAITGLLMLYYKNLRLHRRMLLIIAAFSIIIGLMGTVATIHGTAEAVSIEQKINIKSTADKYYSLEYGYSKLLLWLFPFFVGLFSAVPSLLISQILKKTVKHHTRS
ncbi:MAG: hypothetical protein NTZ95_04110 [Candidatus Omnitrophica bacterium]|nr:hypothetical protein [Candidatus Omnitrophota bacterium]